ncbi:MAG: exo-alpha-sialidase [Planctomycetaceae bacterium]|nr:exo-alpha-sialidase [Planctomycetaceae bacterium]
MLRSSSLLFMLSLGLLVHVKYGWGEESYPWKARQPSGVPVRVAVEPPEDARFAHLSWNKVVRTPRGTLVLAYVAGTFHGNHGGGCPAVSRSVDNGESFSAPHVLREFGPGQDYSHCGNLALGLTGDGALILLAMVFDGDNANHIFGWRSEDDGQTWFAVSTEALGPNKTGSVFGNVLPIPDRGLAVFGHYRAGAQPHTHGIWMSLSQDAGRTWQAPARIYDGFAVEPAVVFSQGRLIGFFRGSGGELGNRGRQAVSVSDDFGRTWTTKPSVLQPCQPDSARLANPFAVENPAQPGDILVLTTERKVPSNRPASIQLWRGSAQQLDWQRVRILLEIPHIPDDPHHDFSYPWLTPLGNNRWLMFYYHGKSRGYCPLWMTNVDLAEAGDS